MLDRIWPDDSVNFAMRFVLRPSIYARHPRPTDGLQECANSRMHSLSGFSLPGMITFLLAGHPRCQDYEVSDTSVDRLVATPGAL